MHGLVGKEAAGCLQGGLGTCRLGLPGPGRQPRVRWEEKAQAPTWGKAWRPGCFSEKAGEGWVVEREQLAGQECAALPLSWGRGERGA